jgi:leucyl-tRNA synthetase
VVPDEYIEKYGADALRMYLMFIGPYDQGGDFRDTGMKGMANFLRRLRELLTSRVGEVTTPELFQKLQQTIAKMDEDLAAFRYNTAIAALMELANVWKQNQQLMGWSDAVQVIKLMAPLAPFMADEMWSALAEDAVDKSVHVQAYPVVDKKALEGKQVTVVFMVNGKMRHSLQLTVDSSQLSEEKMMLMAKNEPKVAKWLLGKEIRKVVWVVPKGNNQGVLNLVVF